MGTAGTLVDMDMLAGCPSPPHVQADIRWHPGACYRGTKLQTAFLHLSSFETVTASPRADGAPCQCDERLRAPLSGFD
jgi:hypothetical protein